MFLPAPTTENSYKTLRGEVFHIRTFAGTPYTPRVHYATSYHDGHTVRSGSMTALRIKLEKGTPRW